MPLLKSTNESKPPNQFRIRLDHDVYIEMMHYMAWANIDNKTSFIKNAIKYILDNDKEWRAFSNAQLKCVK